MSDNKIVYTQKVSLETIFTIYMKAGFTPPDTVIEALVNLYNTTIHLPNPREINIQDDMHFNVKRIIKSHPKLHLKPYLSEPKVVNRLLLKNQMATWFFLLMNMNALMDFMII
jgi:hypothetical protein